MIQSRVVYERSPHFEANAVERIAALYGIREGPGAANEADVGNCDRKNISRGYCATEIDVIGRTDRHWIRVQGVIVIVSVGVPMADAETTLALGGVAEIGMT